MTGEGAFRDVPATPEQVFAVLKGCSIVSELEMTSSVDDLLFVWDADDWKGLSLGLNWLYSIEVSKDEWRNVLLPVKQKTVWDVCCFLAGRVTFPKVETLRALGGECKTGAAFLALKNEMGKLGIKTQGLKPSMPIGETLRRHANDMNLVFSRFLGKKTPKTTIRISTTHKSVGWLVLFAIIVSYTSGFIPYHGLMLLVALIGTLIGIPVLMIIVNRPPASVTMEGVTTFGDAARLIAEAHTNNFS
jgi:hypothetical protein